MTEQTGAEPAENATVDPWLRLDHVSKSFPGVKALDDVSIEIRPHEVLGLIGENGAGKSTLLKVLTGLNRPDTGQVVMRGTPVKLTGITTANKHGIAMVFQEQSLLENVSVGENVLLGNEGDAVNGGLYNWRSLHKHAQTYLDIVSHGIGRISSRTSTHRLSFAKRQMVEVAKALATGERAHAEPIILLDEPTSVLDHGEIETLFSIVQELKQRASVVFVSHRMEEVLELCDRVYVMRDGKVVGERRPAEVSVDDLFAMMVGQDLSEGYYREDAQRDATDRPVLQMAGAGGDHFHDVDLTVHAGEVVSIMGVQESGREDLARSLFGAVKLKSGTITLDGKRFRPGSPAAAVRRGIGYVPSERKVDGCVLGMSVADNLTLAHPNVASTGPVLLPHKQRGVVKKWIKDLRIKTPSPSTPMRSLSGGNQQKVVLAKWLVDKDLTLLVLDTPTRGLDVGAKADVYALIRQLAADGVAVLLIGDTLEEGIHMSHRVLTMRDGRLTGEFTSSPEARPDKAAVLEGMV